MERQKIIDLIAKILAKAGNNSSEHEIEVALLKAQEVAMKYNISLKDIDISNEPDTSQRKNQVLNTEVTEKGIVTWWVGQLGMIIAINFRCDCVEYTARGKGGILHLIGLEEDVLMATQVFQFTKESLDYLSKCYVANLCNKYNNMFMHERPEHLRKFLTLKDFVGAKNDYIRGFLKGLDDKFKEQVEKNGWGLILVKDDAVDEYFKSLKTTKSKQSSIKGSGESVHKEKGYADGKSFQQRSDLLV